VKIPDQFRDLPEAKRLEEAQMRFRAAAAEAKQLSFQNEKRIREIGEQVRSAQNGLQSAQKAFDAATGEPTPVGVSDRVVAEIKKLFPSAQYAEVRTLIDHDCGRTLPFRREAKVDELDFIRLCVLRLSKGDRVELQKWIHLANVDERDVILAASPLMREGNPQ
jgi:hypothetical protein